MSDVSRTVILSILTAMDVEFTENIPLVRAQKKLERAIEKNGVPDNINEEQFNLLVGLGLAEAGLKPKKEKSVAKKKSKKVKDEAEAPVEGEKKAKKKPTPPKRDPNKEGNIPLMRRLLAEKKSEKEIEDVFVARYAETGKTDKAWIKSRINIYKSLATGEPRGKKKAKDGAEGKAKKGKGKKAEAAESEEEAPAKKKGKKKKAEEASGEEE